jgi:hypothetical protein
MPIPDEDNEQRLYARCGEALCWTQMFEQEILNGLLLHAVARKTVPSLAEAEDLLYRRDKQPLRHRLNEIFQRVRPEPDLLPTFYEALEKRNFLVHRFFWDRMELSFTREGREQLIVEVGALAELFRRAYRFMKALTDLYAKQAGVTDAMILQEVKRMLPDGLRKNAL